MLQRAASNAYSWWWASRIRTSQSKWLDGNLEEMDDRVKSILKLLGEEADSFAKRAEMYYKRRPEVISNVEEAYRAYRALAERYDHVSGELHKANHTIATAFPEQVQYAMLEEDDEDDSEHVPKAITPIDPTKIRKSTVEGLMKKRKKDKEKGRRKTKSDSSAIPKGKVRDEINRLQKAILVLQTEKEFIKSSYESGIAKYWEIEKQMAEMQEEVIMLQEESGESGAVFDDDDARAVMTATAIKSCEEAIAKLEESCKESEEMMRVESERIRIAIERLRSIKGEGEGGVEESQSESQLLRDDEVLKDEAEVKQMQNEHLEVIMEKVKHHFELNPETSVEEIAGKIDEIVGKVIDLETTVSSQTAQIGRLSEENGELERNLEELERERSGLVSNSEELSRRLREVEEELVRVRESEKEVREEGRVFGLGFRDVVRSLSGVRERFESGSDVRESELVGAGDVSLRKEGEMRAERDEVEEERDENSELGLTSEPAEKVTDVRESVEELSIEGNYKDLINSQSIGHNDEAEASGEKDSSEENNQNSQVISVVSSVEEKEKDGEIDVKIDEKESEEKFSVISQHGSDEQDSEAALNEIKEINEEKEVREIESIKEISEEGKEEREIESVKEISEEKEEREIESIKKINEEEKEERETESIKEINEEEEKEARPIASSSKNKQKLSILSEIMETDSPKLHKTNKKTLKRGISLQQGEKEYASLTERLPNFRGEERETMLSWQELLLDGLEGRDSILLAEYTSILRNYKETKRRLDELETRNQDQFSETSRVVRELRKDNALKDEEIRILKQLLSSLKTNSEGKNVISEIKEEEEEDLEREKAARVEEKLKGDIDSILDENFKFMLRFSASLNRIQDFESRFKDVQSEMKSPIEESETHSPVSEIQVSEITDSEIPKPESFERKLRILKTEIEVWVEQITMLKQELKSRVSTLNITQDEISQAVRASSAKDGSRLSVYQGEVLSMQQETDKAEGELNAGLDLASGIRLKIESDLGRIREGFELPKMESGETRWTSFKQHPSKNRVPLRNFLFGPKPKKKSKFFMLLNPIIQRHLKDIKGGHFGK
ncbi:hypothetical protein LUZ60_013009 [Juncus effusus]|nr:hypothetical protein LUZ60_013009 [Juncus effusus]